MTGLLEKALRRIETLSDEEQDAIASQILETLDDEEAWQQTYQQNREHFRALAQEALEEHRRGETRPLDELLGGCHHPQRVVFGRAHDDGLLGSSWYPKL
jgi:hypothetical protein